MATGAQVADAAYNTGLRGEALAISIALAKGEGGFDENVLGDTALQDATWGPSVGTWQIRTLKAETGTGGDRDIVALRGHLVRQAQSMFRISNGGTNWSPWTVYNTGAYREHMPEARALAGSATGAGAPAPGGPGAGSGGGGGIGDTLRDAIDRALGIVVGAEGSFSDWLEERVIRGLEVVGGAAILAVGVVMFLDVISTPASREAAGVIRKGGGTLNRLAKDAAVVLAAKKPRG